MENFMQNPTLDGNTFYLSGNKDACVILIHGFTATTVEVRPLAEYLNSHGGFHVHAPLLPGHGTSPVELNKKTWQEWKKSVEIIFLEANKRFEKVYIAGESMGGVLACLIASEFPQIQKVVLYSPAIKVSNLSFSTFIRFFKDYIPKTSGDNKKSNNEIFPWQGYSVNPTNGAFQLYKLQQVTKRRLNLITQPVLIFQSELDKTISSESAQIIYNSIKSRQKELIRLQNSGHTLILGQEFDFVARKTLAFLK
jgi:carboxylesterase